ncbi:hypothetical protein NMG60_11001854, partial [Bertholletia excelsa]
MEMEMEMQTEINHFSHEHPLVLTEEVKDDEGHYQCFGCIKPITSPYYRCNQYMRFLHKSYVNCTSLPYTIFQYGGHEHPLVLWPKPASFSCDACGSSHSEGVSYFCNPCMLWVHQDCASLPSIVEIEEHEHPLLLTNSLNLGYSRYKTYCKICECEEVPKKCWIYHCALCKFSAHLNCVRSDRNSQKFHLLFLDRLPPNELCNGCAKPISSPSYSCSECKFFLHKWCAHLPCEVHHSVHPHHPLSLLARAPDPCGLFKCGDRLPPHELCNGCAKPISSPSYSCSECKFFLHKWCAHLPCEVHHSVHPHHSLSLLARAPDPCGLFKCGVCFNLSNGFAFHCPPCNIFLDVKCGSHPTFVEHQTHKHPLKLRLNLMNRCSACNKIWEGEIFLSFWFYHCRHCDWSAHTRCMCEADDAYSNVKFGITLDLDAHPHPLTLAKKTKKKDLCDHCSDPCEVSCQCHECNFNVHPHCT